MEIGDRLNDIYNYLKNASEKHYVYQKVSSLAKAIIDRNADRYEDDYNYVKAFSEKKTKQNRKKEITNKLSPVAPELAMRIMHASQQDVAANQIREIESAWKWARGKGWLKKYLNTDYDSLVRRSKGLEEDIREDTANLAALKAWRFCLGRMDEHHRRHLAGWQLSMRKYGKGTGKHAHTHKKNAQEHLNECKDAVPAWIMPLHRVYDTVMPKAGSFDLIVVDEASQCGPEALPMMYLGQKVLVVGDDKQISPEAIGVTRDSVQQLMKQYLYDYQYASSFDIESSLYDHCKIRFANQINLREHFRCMPEIIEFSNKHFYQTNPLIPLRQYLPERLEPLQKRYIQTGYREGDGQKVINRPEAEAIVETIASCCAKANYDGMTMGIIVLQGEAQAYLIEQMLLQRIGAEEIDSRKMLCGNPYTFQGDERDVIFLSMVAAPNERIGPLTKPYDERRYNVAASRAKNQMWLFHSVNKNHVSHLCLRSKLLDYYYNPAQRPVVGELKLEDLRKLAYRANRSIEKAPKPFDSWFEVDVYLDIVNRGYRALPQYKFADKVIDIVVQGSVAQLAVECDGDHWHGPDSYHADMERQRKLERCGWKFIRIRECNYYASIERALAPLWEELKYMGIDGEWSSQKNQSAESATNQESEADEEYDEQEDNNGEHEESEMAQDDEQADLLNVIPNEMASGVGLDSIHAALRAKDDIIRRAIVTILKGRPNNSCMRDKLASLILKDWNIRTRGIPFKRFAKKVDNQVVVMSRDGYVILYKSVNERVRLGFEKYPGM